MNLPGSEAANWSIEQSTCGERRSGLDIIDKLATEEWDAWTAIACRIDNDSSKSQWDREIYAEAKTVLSTISGSVGTDDIEEMLGYFLWSFQTFRQLNHDIDSLLYGGIKGSTRIRSLVLPLCSSLIEGCFVNLARALMCGLSSVTGKNYRAQNDLHPLLEVLSKNGFDGLAAVPNIGLRNAISHGGVMIKDGTTGCRVEYTFSRGGERFYEQISSGDLERIALRYLDVISGLMLAFCTFFDDVQAERLFSEIKDSFVRYMPLRQRFLMTTPFSRKLNLSSRRCEPNAQDSKAIASHTPIQECLETSSGPKALILIYLSTRASPLKSSYAQFSGAKIFYGSEQVPKK